jgi:hypothetical protein
MEKIEPTIRCPMDDFPWKLVPCLVLHRDFLEWKYSLVPIYGDGNLFARNFQHAQINSLVPFSTTVLPCPAEMILNSGPIL